MLKHRLHPLHRAVADAATARRLRDADASSQQLADALLDRVADLGPFHGSTLPAAGAIIGQRQRDAVFTSADQPQPVVIPSYPVEAWQRTVGD